MDDHRVAHRRMGRQARARFAVIPCLAALLACSPRDGQARSHQAPATPIVLSEIMVDPTGLGRVREYVELYNRSGESVDLNGWTLGDTLDLDALVAVSSGLVLAAGQYALVLDPDYFTVEEPYPDIPAEALIITIEDKTFGRYGLTNDATKTVILRSPDGEVQSTTYTPDDVQKGYSREKIDLDGDDSRANWALSLVAEGTPGRPNSRRILDRDLVLVTLAAAYDTIHPPATVSVRAHVANAGRNPVSGARIVLFSDLDGDSAYSPGDHVLMETGVSPLARGEEAEVTCLWEVDRPLEAPARGAVMLDGEERPLDNVRPLAVVVGMPPEVLRITEVMADPTGGEGQWVEIGSVGNLRVSLAGCRLVAGRSSAAVAGPAAPLAPGDFVVFAEYPDSLRKRYGFAVPIAPLAARFPHLSTSEQAARTVQFQDATGRIVDRATYPVPEPGRSLELADLDRSGDDPTAWRTVWGPYSATPGMPNQAMVPPAESATVAVGPSPPADTVGIALDLPESPVYLTIRIYDALGREVRRLLDGERWPAHACFRWDGADGRGVPVPTGMYVLLVEATAVESGKSYRLVRSVVIARRR